MKRTLLIASSVVLILVSLFTFWINWEYLFLSKNYRAHNSFTHHKRILSQKSFSKCMAVNRSPSPEYPFSGGGRIHIPQIASMHKSHDGPLFVVNLREDDGFYLAEHPIAHYGMYIKNNDFHFRLSSKPRKKWLYSFRKWISGVPQTIEDFNPASLETESQILERLGIHYVHFELLRQAFASKWDFVDNAIKLFESLPPKSWIHFHCAGGRGRTTTLMIMYDIFRNAHSTSLNEILAHHYCLGGENVQNVNTLPHGSWSRKNLNGRLRLLENFYDYMTSPDGYPHKTWLKWLDERDIPVEFTLA